jgi:acetyl-CoA carboxylase biotin carboxyl carrier protein
MPRKPVRLIGRAANEWPLIRLTCLRKPLYLNAQSAGDHVELKDIKAIIDLMKKNDLSIFQMEKDGFKLKLQKGVGDQPMMQAPAPLPIAMPIAASMAAAAPAPAAAAAPAPAPAAEEPKAPLKDIVSPMVGTFYRAGSPESPAFVDIGKEVTEESVVCIIEAMKVMNEIKAEVTGTIAEIVAENGKPVQFGQVLFRVR